MKTDRELLELAAKAAGIAVIPYTWNKGTGWDHEGFTLAGEGPYEWNPIEDDGDALRLAVKLNLNIFSVGRYAYAMESESNGDDEQKVDHANDPYAATRRAIVRAAAEIGGAA